MIKHMMMKSTAHHVEVTPLHTKHRRDVWCGDVVCMYILLMYNTVVYYDVVPYNVSNIHHVV